MNNDEIVRVACEIRKDIVKMTYNSGVKGAHLGGSMSIADILAVLYASIMKYDISNYEDENRDRLIVSKAHAAMALYASLHWAGYLSDADIAGAMHGNSQFYEHPKKSLKHGIEFSGGSLGQGLSLGCGTALALKMKKIASRVYVVLGDGECNEGQVWEAAAAIASFKLNNVTVIVDSNGLQYDGRNESIMNMGDIKSIWSNLGYDAYEVDGHDVEALQYALMKTGESPVAIIAKTVKGKGISFAENETSWHTGRLTEELYKQAMEELSV